MAQSNAYSNNDNCKEELPVENAEYIKTHMEALRAKCMQINSCVDVLLEDENLLVVLKGSNLSLNKTCSLVYKSSFDAYSNFSGKCSAEDRKQIHNSVEQDLQRQIESKTTIWKNVTKCLENNYGDGEELSYVDKICGLAYNKTQICRTIKNAHKTVEDYINGQIHNIKCSCRSLQNDGSKEFPMPILIGAAVGCVLLLLLLVVVGYCCYRRSKSQKRQNKTPNVIYVQAPNSDNCPVYQEIFDGKSPSANPPTLPMRYTPQLANKANVSQMSDQFDEQGYLEPAGLSLRLRPRLSIPGKDNKGYGTPPEYTEKDVNEDSNNENSYFEPIPSPSEDVDKGYDTLENRKRDLEKTKLTSNAQERPDTGSVPLGPVPAKRTKKDDRITESHYFVLEQDDKTRAENTTV